MDVEDIPLGTDFRTYIAEQIQRCDVVLVVIGPRWLGHDTSGLARFADPGDPVRCEVETALQAGRRTIPVLIDGAKMPQPAELPESLADFCYLNAATVGSGADFRPTIERLIARLEAPRRTGGPKERARRAIDTLSLKRPLGRLVAAVCAAGLGVSGAFANWERIFPAPEYPPAIFLMPPKHEADRAEASLVEDLFLQVWGPYFDGLSKQSGLGVVPNNDELHRPASKFKELFFGPQSYSWATVLKNVATYSHIVKRKVERLARSIILSQDDRIRLRVEIGSFDYQNHSFQPNPHLEVEVIGNQKDRKLLAAVASYRVVRNVLMESGHPPSPQLESAVTGQFMKLFRELRPSLDGDGGGAQSCTTFECLDRLDRRLIDQAGRSNAPSGAVATATEAARLSRGPGRP